MHYFHITAVSLTVAVGLLSLLISQQQQCVVEARQDNKKPHTTMHLQRAFRFDRASSSFSPPSFLRLSNEQKWRRAHRRFGGKKQTQETLESSSSKGHTISLMGDIWPVSVFWSTVQVGTPARSLAVAIDSGSPELMVAGPHCNGCPTTFPNVPYDPALSSTSSPLGTTFNYSYETCVPWNPVESCYIQGSYYSDVVSFAGFSRSSGTGAAVRVQIGQIRNQTANFYQFQKIGGVLGLNSHDTGGVFWQLCTHGALDECVWAICMRRGILSNGSLTIGGINPLLASGPMRYVPNVQAIPGGNYYGVNMMEIRIGGRPIRGFSTTPTILDTGTNDVLFASDIYKSIHEAVCSTRDINGGSKLAHCDAFFENPKFCAFLTSAEIDAYPNISIVLSDEITLHMGPRDYLLFSSPVASAAGQVCFGIGNGGGTSSAPGYNILGDSIMRGYYLVFDGVYRKIGWANVNDAMCGSVEWVKMILESQR